MNFKTSQNFLKVCLTLLCSVPTYIHLKSQVLAGGEEHAIFICSSSDAMSTGWNIDGQLGNGNSTNQHSPVAVISLTNLTNVSAGSRHSLFLRNDATVWGTGRSEERRVGKSVDLGGGRIFKK